MQIRKQKTHSLSQCIILSYTARTGLLFFTGYKYLSFSIDLRLIRCCINRLHSVELSILWSVTAFSFIVQQQMTVSLRYISQNGSVLFRERLHRITFFFIKVDLNSKLVYVFLDGIGGGLLTLGKTGSQFFLINGNIYFKPCLLIPNNPQYNVSSILGGYKPSC